MAVLRSTPREYELYEALALSRNRDHDDEAGVKADGR